MILIRWPLVAMLFAAFLLTSNLQASLKLTFDVSKLTYAWTGAATSPQLTISLNTDVRLWVVGSDLTGGSGAIGMPSSPITATPSNVYFQSLYFFQKGLAAPNIVTTPSLSVLADMAYLSNYSVDGAVSAESTVVEIIGDGSGVSYAGVNVAESEFLALDGYPLYFMTHTFSPDTGNSRVFFPTQVGSIEVVPEPSTYALLAMSAAGALWLARRRR